MGQCKFCIQIIIIIIIIIRIIIIIIIVIKKRIKIKRNEADGVREE